MAIGHQYCFTPLPPIRQPRCLLIPVNEPRHLGLSTSFPASHCHVGHCHVCLYVGEQSRQPFIVCLLISILKLRLKEGLPLINTIYVVYAELRYLRFIITANRSLRHVWFGCRHAAIVMHAQITLSRITPLYSFTPLFNRPGGINTPPVYHGHALVNFVYYAIFTTPPSHAAVSLLQFQ